MGKGKLLNSFINGILEEVILSQCWRMSRSYPDKWRRKSQADRTVTSKAQKLGEVLEHSDHQGLAPGGKTESRGIMNTGPAEFSLLARLCPHLCTLCCNHLILNLTHLTVRKKTKETKVLLILLTSDLQHTVVPRDFLLLAKTHAWHRTTLSNVSLIPAGKKKKKKILQPQLFTKTVRKSRYLSTWQIIQRMPLGFFL